MLSDNQQHNLNICLLILILHCYLNYWEIYSCILTVIFISVVSSWYASSSMRREFGKGFVTNTDSKCFLRILVVVREPLEALDAAWRIRYAMSMLMMLARIYVRNLTRFEAQTESCDMLFSRNANTDRWIFVKSCAEWWFM